MGDLPLFMTHLSAAKLEELRERNVPLSTRLSLVLEHLQAVDPASSEAIQRYRNTRADFAEGTTVKRDSSEAVEMAAELLARERHDIAQGKSSGEPAVIACSVLASVPMEQRGTAWAKSASEAHALLANAHRIAGRLEEAWQELLISNAVARQREIGYPTVELANLAASLHRDRLRYRDAAVSYERAITAAEAAGLATQVVQALIGRSILSGRHGRYQEAASLCQEALERLPEAEPELELAIRINLAHFWTNAGLVRVARGELTRLQPLLERVGTAPVKLRCRWIEARNTSASGEWAAAEQLFREALEGLKALDRPYDVVGVVLDFALTLRLIPQLDEISKLAAEVAPYLARTTIAPERAATVLEVLRRELSSSADFRFITAVRLEAEHRPLANK